MVLPVIYFLARTYSGSSFYLYNLGQIIHSFYISAARSEDITTQAASTQMDHLG